MNPTTPLRTPLRTSSRLFLKGVQVIAVFGVIWGLYGYIDFILHPLAEDMYYYTLLTRPANYLIVCPLILAVGVLIIRRQPDNVIGYLIILWGLLSAAPSRVSSGPLPLSITSLYETSVAWNALFCMVALFPAGQPYPSKVGRWYLGLVASLFVIGILFVVTLREPSPGFLNPLYIPQLAALAPVIQTVTGVLVILEIILPLVFLILRFRKASPSERQQLKWITLSSVIMIGLVATTFVIPQVFLGIDLGNSSFVKNLMFAAVALFPPLTIGYAILRQRLYDIDIIIRRTLIYSVLTAILAAVYFGSVILVQQLFRAATGQWSDLAIVISTLAIAALFSPLRRRTQDVINSRLYRRKYDAEKTLEKFNRTLRDEVDLDTLKMSVLNVIDETMQPTRVALWVRPIDQSYVEK